MIKVYTSHISTAEADVIVNHIATNFSLLDPFVDGFFEPNYNESKNLPLGDFAVGDPGKMWAKKVFHLSVLDAERGHAINPIELEKLLRSVMSWCNVNAFNTIAVPLVELREHGLSAIDIKNSIIKVAKEFENIQTYIFEGSNYESKSN